MPDPEPVTLSTLGPHSPEYTRRVAGVAAEAVRVLNHATGNHAAEALEFPSDVDTVLAHLEALAAMLPQLHGQLLAWLQDQNSAGRIRLDHGRDSVAAVMEVGMDLLDASVAAGRLQDALTAARCWTATMAAAGGGTDG